MSNEKCPSISVHQSKGEKRKKGCRVTCHFKNIYKIYPIFLITNFFFLSTMLCLEQIKTIITAGNFQLSN